MINQSPARTIIYFIITIALIIGLSIISNQLWGGKSEELPEMKDLLISEDLTIAEFGLKNKISDSVLKEIFGLQSKSELEKKLGEFGELEQVKTLIIKKMALAAEHASKNWIKIPVKFACWFIFLTGVFIFLSKRKATPGLRKWLLLVAVAIFGVILGSDPSPMGTVKDAIHLFGTTRAIFPPRMIALTIFLLMVFLANKYICAWGCQAGTLQDLIFQFNQTDKRKAIIGKQIKIPFIVTNGIRILFFLMFTSITFLWGTDIINFVDPFKIFKPATLGIIGSIAIGALLFLSLFIYRPWCHLFCPFGLVGWLVEKISLVKISVNYETCIACNKCTQACPSTVMEAILKRDKKTIPDCFACYRCREVCPTDSIRFSTRKRTLPPEGHFDKK
ncbi:4Fe-4S dicluster domain-containing protein [candidate division KSB1 bacterium]|nr:4Fe-4S dicluster domain-containing protein [candidate division KSB1 bacterium]